MLVGIDVNARATEELLLMVSVVIVLARIKEANIALIITFYRPLLVNLIFGIPKGYTTAG